MKKSLLFAYGILIATFLCMTAMSVSQGSADEAHPAGDRETDHGKPSQYDAQLAEKLGADAYGMRSYVMAFLKAGRLEMEPHPWYGSAALQMVNQWHGRIAQKNP